MTSKVNLEFLINNPELFDYCWNCGSLSRKQDKKECPDCKDVDGYVNFDLSMIGEFISEKEKESLIPVVD